MVLNDMSAGPMNEESTARTRHRLDASRRRLEVSELLLDRSARLLLPHVPPAPIRRPPRSAWWWDALAAENARSLRESREVAVSLISEAAEMRMISQQTRWLASRSRIRSSEQRARASSLKAKPAPLA
jgi:hypothetical protein